MSHQRIVAIYLAEPARTSELGGLLAGNDLAPLFANNSDELHKILNGQRVDLLIIENQLKGFLTGLQILEHLHKDLAKPPTLLVGMPSGDDREKAEALVLSGTVPATIAVAELADAARKVLGSEAQKAPIFAINIEARRLVQSSDAIQPLPQILLKISKHLDHNNSSIAELAKDIALDAKLTAMLLRLVNSTAFGLRKKLTRVDEAVTYLGIRRCVSIVISAYLIGAQKGMAGKLTDSLRMWHQRRSILIASTASAFAQKCEGLSTETAYVLGLLQDLGILVMSHGYGERYVQLLDRVKQIGQLRQDVLEQKEFGITHPEVSAALLLKWELPASMIPPVLHHHSSTEPKQISSVERRFLNVMRVGDSLANVLDHCSPHRNQILNQCLRDGGFGSAEESKATLAAAVAKTVESSQLFSMPAPDPVALQTMLDKIAAEAQVEVNSLTAGEELPPLHESGPIEQPAGQSSAPVEGPFVVIVQGTTTPSETLSQYLESGGFRPVICSAGAEARQYANGAAAVLCDFSPASDAAFDTVRGLRSDGYVRSIIMISDDPTRSLVLRAIQAGINEYLPKPFTRTTLLEKVGASPIHLQ